MGLLSPKKDGKPAAKVDAESTRRMHLYQQDQETLALIKDLLSVSSNDRVVQDALDKLIDLTVHPDASVAQYNSQTIFRFGGHLAALHALERQQHQQDDGQQQEEDDSGAETMTVHVMNLLQNLTGYGDANLRWTVADMGGFALAIDAMKRFPDSPDAAECGCGLIMNLVGSSSSSGEVSANPPASNNNNNNHAVDMAILQAGENAMIPIIVAAMQKWYDRRDVIRYGCGALDNIAESASDEVKEAIITADGLETLARARKLHRDDPDIASRAGEALKRLV